MGLIQLMDWGFELQIVPPHILFTALKRGDHKMSVTKFTLVTKPEQLSLSLSWDFFGFALATCYQRKLI